jgi:hypothetical protein
MYHLRHEDGRMKITPAIARDLIRAHSEADPPRRVNIESRIREYAEIMRKGEWEDIPYPDPQAEIMIAGPYGWERDGVRTNPGVILEGWHRLNAVVLADVPIMATLIYIS